LILDVVGTPSVSLLFAFFPHVVVVVPRAHILATGQMDDFDEITSARSKFALFPSLVSFKRQDAYCSATFVLFCRDYLRQLPFRMQRNFKEICPKATPNAVDFIKKCLT
jgi:hypothetical protein